MAADEQTSAEHRRVCGDALHDAYIWPGVYHLRTYLLWIGLKSWWRRQRLHPTARLASWLCSMRGRETANIRIECHLVIILPHFRAIDREMRPRSRRDNKRGRLFRRSAERRHRRRSDVVARRRLYTATTTAAADDGIRGRGGRANWIDRNF